MDEMSSLVYFTRYNNALILHILGIQPLKRVRHHPWTKHIHLRVMTTNDHENTYRPHFIIMRVP